MGRGFYAVLVAAAVSYITVTAPATVAPACTTKDAGRPTSAQQSNLPGSIWYAAPAQSQMTMRLPRGQDVNDYPSPLTMFPTVFQQPRDSDKRTKLPAFAVSTCDRPA